jgi:hypothetical protein
MPIENPAAQGQPQDLRYADMGYYNMVNDHHPPLHERHAINNYAGVALNVPAQAQAQAAPPAPVCPTSLFCIRTSNQTFRLRRSTYLMTQLCTLRLALLEASSMKCLTRASPTG